MPFRSFRAPETGKIRVPFTFSPKGHAGAPRTPEGGLQVKPRNTPSPAQQRINTEAGRPANSSQIGPGHRDAPTTGEQATPEQIAAQNRNDPNSQHSPEGQARSKKDFMEKVKNGALGSLALLPMALILAAMIQGLMDCKNIDQAEPTIKSIDSAAWPDYPEWWPDWAPSPKGDKNKVWISYSPAVHLLTTDTIKISTSNTSGDVQTSITGEHAVINNDDDSMTQIQIATEFDPNETDFSNVLAKFTITTNCADRMAYSAGQDIKAITEAGGNAFGAAFDWLPSFRTVLYVIVFILALWLFIKGISIIRS
jgi:hypothetical protein